MALQPRFPVIRALGIAVAVASGTAFLSFSRAGDPEPNQSVTYELEVLFDPTSAQCPGALTSPYVQPDVGSQGGAFVVFPAADCEATWWLPGFDVGSAYYAKVGSVILSEDPGLCVAWSSWSAGATGETGEHCSSTPRAKLEVFPAICANNTLLPWKMTSHQNRRTAPVGIDFVEFSRNGSCYG